MECIIFGRKNYIVNDTVLRRLIAFTDACLLVVQCREQVEASFNVTDK